MHTTRKHNRQHGLRHLVWSCVAVAGIGAGFTTTASAHDYVYSPRAHFDPYVVIDRQHSMPRWLRRNHRFMRWYWRNQLHYAQHVSWQRLYDVYKVERYYKRHPRKHRRYPAWYRKHQKRYTRGYYSRHKHYH